MSSSQTVTGKVLGHPLYTVQSGYQSQSQPVEPFEQRNALTLVEAQDGHDYLIASGGRGNGAAVSILHAVGCRKCNLR